MRFLEAEESHGLLSLSLRPRKAGGVIRNTPRCILGQMPENQRGQWYPRAGEMRLNVPVQTGKQTKRVKFLLPLPITLLRPSVDWLMPTHCFTESCDSTKTKS